MPANAKNWLKVCGEENSALQDELSTAVSSRISGGEYKAADVEHIDSLPLRLLQKSADFDDQRLERLRALCKLWDIELKPGAITSHRAVIGPIIVGVKRLFFPVLRAF